MQILKAASALSCLTSSLAHLQPNPGNRHVPAAPTAEPAHAPAATPAGNVYKTAMPAVQATPHLWLRADVTAPVEALKIKTTSKKTTTRTTTRRTGNSTNAASPMTAYPWRAAGVAAGAVWLADAIQS